MNWQIVIVVLLGLYFLYPSPVESKPVKEIKQDIGFDVILPETNDFKNARVTLVSGFKNHTKLNVSGLVHFPIDSLAIIDKIKVRTTGGKAYNYAEQSNPGQLVVSPIPCYDCNFKGWRH